MQFKINGTILKINFTFLISFLFFSLNNNLRAYLLSVIASLLHEIVHVLFIVLYKDKITKITLNIFGGKIEKANTKLLSNKKEVLINLSAPIFNILIGVTTLSIDKNNQWGIVNLFIGIFNIIPFVNFDGGRGLYYFITDISTEKNAKKFLTIMSIIVCFLFTSFSIIVFVKYYKNYFLLLISIFMIFSLFLFENL